MKNKLGKRIAMMFMALIMAMTMGTATASVFAANPDTGDVLTVENVEAGATVTAYKLVKEVKGEWVKTSDKITIADPSNPTSAEIAAIAASSEQLAALESFTLEYADADGVYMKDGKTPGLYLILVTGTGATLYNPMIVSIDYDGTIDKVNANDSFRDGTNVAYAKSSTPEVKKSNDQAGTTVNGGTTDKGTSASIGDEVGFTIETTIPSYSAQYTNIKFDITDTLDEGLTPPAAADNVTVTVGGTAVTASDTTYTFKKEGNGFRIIFASAYIKSLAGKTADERAVVVKYNATVNDKAKFNYIPNNNKAEIEFTNKPNGDTHKEEDNSKIYTFGLDANLNGTATEKNKKTHEIIKLNENGDKQTLEYKEDGTETTVQNPLEGAVFGLYSDNNCQNQIREATTTSNGYMEMTGLKEGTYYLKEISAPAGYVPSSDIHEINISAKYDDKGVLQQHTVTIDGKITSTYTATYDKGVIENITATSETLFIKNSKTPGLPSTGGIGTYIFTIMGVMIMATAVIMLRRRSRKA